MLEAGWDFLIKPIPEEAFKCPFFLAALFVLLTKNILLIEEWVRNLLFSSPAATPLDADHENNQVQIVSGARSCSCTKETRSLAQKPPWLNLDGEKNTCGTCRCVCGTCGSWEKKGLSSGLMWWENSLPFQELSYRSICGQNKLIYEWMDEQVNGGEK